MEQQQKQPGLKQQFFAKCRMQNKSYKTAAAYWGWIFQFLDWHRQRCGQWIKPQEMGRAEIEAFLSYLANVRNVAPSTQNQAFCAIVFLYRQLLEIKVEGIDAARAKRNFYIPTVLSESEVVRLMSQLSGRNRLIAYLCYGAGMRIGEVFQLRVKDVDFENKLIHVRQAKGVKDRTVQLPEMAVPLLRRQIDETKRLHAIDTAKGRPCVPLPYAFAKKAPRSAGDLGWYWLFCSERYLDETDPKQRGYFGRWHQDETTFTKPLADAVRNADPPIYKRVTSHTFRHSFATHLMNKNVPVVQIAELMGHNSIETTQIYTHCMDRGATSIRSPLDSLMARS